MYNSTSSILKTPSTGYSSNQHYGATSSGQQRYPSLDYISTLLEESQKLYNKLAKELVDESINDYAYIILSSSYHFCHQLTKNKSHHRQKAAIQSNMDTAEHKFVQSEIDNEDQDN